LGVPAQDAPFVGSLMGSKMVTNEFVAYAALAPRIADHSLDPRSLAIASVALCGFANFSSVAMQIGGIGEMAPSRKQDLARLGFKALLCGTMASYVSSALAGLLVGMNASTENAWMAGGIMLASIGLIFISRFLPDGSRVIAESAASALPGTPGAPIDTQSASGGLPISQSRASTRPKLVTTQPPNARS
jgi:hypothetical protein